MSWNKPDDVLLRQSASLSLFHLTLHEDENAESYENTPSFATVVKQLGCSVTRAVREIQHQTWPSAPTSSFSSSSPSAGMLTLLDTLEMTLANLSDEARGRVCWSALFFDDKDNDAGVGGTQGHITTLLSLAKSLYEALVVVSEKQQQQQQQDSSFSSNNDGSVAFIASVTKSLLRSVSHLLRLPGVASAAKDETLSSAVVPPPTTTTTTTGRSDVEAKRGVTIANALSKLLCAMFLGSPNVEALAALSVLLLHTPVHQKAAKIFSPKFLPQTMQTLCDSVLRGIRKNTSGTTDLSDAGSRQVDAHVQAQSNSNEAALSAALLVDIAQTPLADISRHFTAYTQLNTFYTELIAWITAQLKSAELFSPSRDGREYDVSNKEKNDAFRSVDLNKENMGRSNYSAVSSATTFSCRRLATIKHCLCVVRLLKVVLKLDRRSGNSEGTDGAALLEIKEAIVTFVKQTVLQFLSTVSAGRNDDDGKAAAGLREQVRYLWLELVELAALAAVGNAELCRFIRHKWVEASQCAALDVIGARAAGLLALVGACTRSKSTACEAHRHATTLYSSMFGEGGCNDGNAVATTPETARVLREHAARIAQLDNRGGEGGILVDEAIGLLAEMSGFDNNDAGFLVRFLQRNRRNDVVASSAPDTVMAFSSSNINTQGNDRGETTRSCVDKQGEGASVFRHEVASLTTKLSEATRQLAQAAAERDRANEKEASMARQLDNTYLKLVLLARAHDELEAGALSLASEREGLKQHLALANDIHQQELRALEQQREQQERETRAVKDAWRVEEERLKKRNAVLEAEVRKLELRCRGNDEKVQQLELVVRERDAKLENKQQRIAQLEMRVDHFSELNHKIRSMVGDA